jgi:hypothetical protein
MPPPLRTGRCSNVGIGALQSELVTLTKAGRWDELGKSVDDDVLAMFAATGTPAKVAHQLRERYAGVAQRLTLYAPYEVDPDTWLEVASEARRPS